VGQSLVYDIQLRAGGVEVVVDVQAEAPVIEVERTQQANTISRIQVENLPNVSRDFTSYVFTLPGVVSSNAPRAQGAQRFSGFASSGFSIGGSNGRNNLVTVDGGENEYGSGQLRFLLIPEAVQEFQVNRNASTAEFGFTAGTAVNVVTKSGTNDFHGSAYVFYRSDKTSARDPFDFSSRSASERQIYPGFTFGGPIKKNKLFFFTNYERLQSDVPRFRSYTNNALLRPTANQLALLARLDAVPSANVQRISSNLRAALTTTEATFPNTFAFLRESEGAFTSVARLNNWSTRLDWQASDSDSITGRFTYSRNFSDFLGTEPTQSPSFSGTLTVRDYTTLVTWTRNFSSTVVNQARVQIVPNNSAKALPPDEERTGVIIANLIGIGRNFQFPFNTLQDRYQFEDNLSWARGNHTFKFGVSYRPVKYEVRNELWLGGEWQFLSSVYPVILGVPAADQVGFSVGVCTAFGVPLAQCNQAAVLGLTAGSALNSLQSFNFNLPTLYRQGFNNPVWKNTAHYLGVFAQDSWKVNSRFTLDFGARIDYDGEPEPVPQHTYVSPRLGFAWDVMGDKKTVLRGGGGLFYSPIYYQIAYLTNLLDDSGEFINQVARVGLPAAQLWGAGRALGKLPLNRLSEAELNGLGVPTGPKTAGRVIFELDPDYKNNYSAQASFGIQRQITNNMSIEVAYQMYRGIHIQQPVALNYVEATEAQRAARCTVPGALNAACNPVFGPLYIIDPARGGDPTITQFTSYASRGNSIYHGMTASLTKRYSNHFSFQANYTFSKSIDDVTDFNSAFYGPFPTRLNLERSLSTFDIRHNFVFSGVFVSPFRSGSGENLVSRILADISLSPIISLRTGIPFSLLTGVDTNGDTRANNDRLFAIGRNTGIGPNFRRVDLRLNKAFKIADDGRVRFEFIAEAINLFNRTNYASVREIIGPDPNHPDYNRGTFRLEGSKDRDFRRGEPLSFTSAFDPRRIQFGLKFAF
jgi:hypothetical protein